MCAIISNKVSNCTEEFSRQARKRKEVTEVIEITAWMDKFLQVLNESFGERIWFVGL